MSRMIDADALYERTAEWEAQALHMVEVTMNDEDQTKWQKWSTVLAERSAFKHDIADAPTIEPRKKGKWIKISPANIYECSVCGQNVMTNDIETYKFCHGCGADLRGEENEEA